MKKAFLTVLAAVLVLGATNVSAMSESELKAKLTKTYTINGVEYKADASVVKQISDYLDTFEVSADDADFIAQKVDEAVKVVEESGVKDVKKLSSTAKNTILDKVAEISANTSVKMNVAEDGTVVVYNPNTGAEWSRVTDLIKYTDNSAILMVAGIVSVLGIAVATRKIAKANA